MTFDAEAEAIARRLEAAARADGAAISGDGRVRPEAAARLLDVHPETLRRWRSTGEGPPLFLLGGRVSYALADLARYVLTSRMSAAQFSESPHARANAGTDVPTEDDTPGMLRVSPRHRRP